MAGIGVYLRGPRGQKRDAQRQEITRWLMAHDYHPSAVIWFEDTEKRPSINRPGFQSLRAAVKDGDVKTVVVWKLDHLARSQREAISTISYWCESGVRIVSVAQQIDLRGATGKLVADVLFGITQIEAERSRERQAAGIEAAKKRGVYRGRKAGTLKADPARARALKKQGMKSKDIMELLGIRSRATLAKYLAGDT